MANANKDFEKRYEKLNTKQRQAVDNIDGPVLVVAGPGTGKTELLAIRTANILKLTDILPTNILLLTFTEAGSFNMRERMIKLIGEVGYRIPIYTFHAFASDIINKNSEYFFEGAKFRAATEIDQINIVENIIKNLPRKNPLSSFHPELGHVYLRDIISSIRDLKKGNYTPEALARKLAQNIIELKALNNICDGLSEISGKRKYSDILPTYLEIYNKLKYLSSKPLEKGLGEGVTNEIAKVLLTTLELAIKTASEEEKSNQLTAWKNAYTIKIENNSKNTVFILKDAEPYRLEKLESLLYVFGLYQSELYKQGIYDFEDMILEVIKVLKTYPNLKAQLQERYQYIMIDEFQDTNESQFQLALELAKNQSDVLNNPNILAVGDDDQAIYKFQGAELNNMYSFLDNFPTTKTIVLENNYRSTQEILDFSREVITKANDRLEVRDKNISKKLVASNEIIASENNAKIHTEKFDSDILEYNFIGNEIKKLITNGLDPKEISVICRKHEQLKELSNILNNFKIPYSYTKRENVLEKPHIHELVTIVKFLHLQTEGLGVELLPEILAYKFWDLDRIEIWKIAEKVRQGIEVESENENKPKWKKASWLEIMITNENKKIKDLGLFFIDLIIKSKSTPIEYLLDEIIGTTEFLWEDSEHDDSLMLPTNNSAKFISPYKTYYFNNQKFDHNRLEYLDFLTTLRTFIGALREFHTKQVLLAKDIFQFVEIYNGNNLTLTSVSPFASGENAVSLLTAHSAKGLEFGYVFLLSANADVWTRGNSGSRIQFPINMPLSPEGENDDDKIRLLYVALTRAKHTLYITYSSQIIPYLINEKFDKEIKKKVELSKEIKDSFTLIPKQDYMEDEKQLLKRLLENYKMPVTHLNNFLNFIKVGPQKFTEQNLLRFPQAITPSGAYGSAMHDAVERYFLYFKKYNKKQNVEDVQENFKNYLERAHLTNTDFNKYLESGNKNLEIYISFMKKRNILPDTKVETKFTNEDVMIDQCNITGNIDRMEFVGGNEIIVTDLKTGESYYSFEQKNLQDYEKIKLHFYKYQITFYAHLVENSRTFQNYKVKAGNLEFLEADNNGKIIILPFLLDNEIKERVKRLANIVCAKIRNLDFPNTENYAQNIKGILEFEEDLLSGKI